MSLENGIGVRAEPRIDGHLFKLAQLYGGRCYTFLVLAHVIQLTEVYISLTYGTLSQLQMASATSHVVLINQLTTKTFGIASIPTQRDNPADPSSNNND